MLLTRQKLLAISYLHSQLFQTSKSFERYRSCNTRQCYRIVPCRHLCDTFIRANSVIILALNRIHRRTRLYAQNARKRSSKRAGDRIAEIYRDPFVCIHCANVFPHAYTPAWYTPLYPYNRYPLQRENYCSSRRITTCSAVRMRGATLPATTIISLRLRAPQTVVAG